MLLELNIKNFILIEYLSIKFQKGLNVLSGETGAGKSIILGALNLLLGGRGSISSIRTGTEEAVVECVLEINDIGSLKNALFQKGIPLENNDLYLRRVITKAGKSRSYINNVNVTSKELAVIGKALFDLHGQHEQQSLLDLNMQLQYLDNFVKANPQLVKYREIYAAYQKTKNDLNSCLMDESEKEREKDYLEFTIREIKEANLQENEDRQLEEKLNVLSNYEELFQNINETYKLLAENHGGSLLGLRKSLSLIEKCARLDDSLISLSHFFTDLFYSLEDKLETIRDYKQKLRFDPGELESVSERLENIKKLKKKYGTTIYDILTYLKKSKTKLENLEHSEEKKQNLQKELAALKIKLNKSAEELSEVRKMGIQSLEKQVQTELKFLNMEKTSFKIQNTWEETTEQNNHCVQIKNKSYKMTEKGIDNIEYLITTNPGEPFLPLKKIISGGEVSRIMLALKKVLASSDQVETLIFDEIDAGIGGKTAVAVANRLDEISRHKQIICITHLAQIAAKGDHNLAVLKEYQQDRAVTRIKYLNKEEKIKEIARMISGMETELALKHARELVK